MFVWIFFAMVFMHLLEDFHLQGCLANLKQKSFWKDLCYNKAYKDATNLTKDDAEKAKDTYNRDIKKYGKDWIPSLIAHSFEWTIFMMSPIFAYTYFIRGISGFTGMLSYVLATLVLVNVATHFIIDTLKCNSFKINLIQDQVFHLCQIIVTLIIFIIFIY